MTTPEYVNAMRNLTADERNRVLGPGLQNIPMSEFLARTAPSMLATQIHDPDHLRRIISALEESRWRDQENAKWWLWFVGIIACVVGALLGIGLVEALR